MTRGVLLYAHNNEDINYGLLALGQARRIRQFLKLPVSLVADAATLESLDGLVNNWRSAFDRIIEQASSTDQTKRYVDRQLTFHNLDRVTSWDLTPYDETLVLDTDIIIQSDRLNRPWSMLEHLIVCDRSTNLWNQTDDEFVWVNDRSIKFYWATVFYFRKTPESKIFFDYCKHIKQNYNWFRYVHELLAGPVRNDFIWSIALHDLNYPTRTIPFNLMHSNVQDKIMKIADTGITMLTPHGLSKVPTDLHVFNKYDLIEHVKEELGL